MKKSVIIVDDEMPSREMLKSIIDWEKTEYEITKEFINGKEALEYYIHNPVDYIITDIQMPVMDGITLIKDIKGINPHQPIIILSCHEKFSYAKEAMKYGVKDYLIKDMLTKEDILEALLGAKEPLTESQNMESLKDHTQDVFSIQDNQLQEWLYDDTAIRDSQRINQGYYTIMIVNLASKKIYESYSDTYEKDLIDQIRRDLISEQIVKPNYITIDDTFDLVILMPVEQIASQIKFIYDCQKQASMIRTVIQKLCDDEITIGISNGFSGFNRIKEHFEEAKKACQYRVFLGNDKNLFSSTVFNHMKSFNPEKLETYLQRLQTQLFLHNYDMVIQILEKIYKENIKGFMQFHFIKYVNARMLSMIINYIKAHNMTYKDVFGKDFIPLNELEEMCTIEEILEWFRLNITNIRNSREGKINDHYSLRVIQAQSLLKEHYKLGIGLQEIAEQLGVHKVYLSRLFKEETGKTITQYLQDLRIEEVKRLLESTNKSMADIAEELNYNHPQQLSMAFKKEMNMTPKAYRNQYYKKKG